MYWYYVFAVFFVLGIFGDLSLAFLERFRSKIQKKEIGLKIKHTRLHHSCVGLGCFVVSIFIFSLGLVSFGLGLVVSHTIREKRFLFVETKEKIWF
ncbi:hypothetical protein CMI41_04295 [Candidatus Pacearchaeota archaeon]|nr:hypothetical protein [Candidatus Pacearchaeota archaeon]|tara:strand:+ start:5180 stop:5467 length:288 start_codon:yes stop_codon:yes gene_type:complete